MQLHYLLDLIREYSSTSEWWNKFYYTWLISDEAIFSVFILFLCLCAARVCKGACAPVVVKDNSQESILTFRFVLRQVLNQPPFDTEGSC